MALKDVPETFSIDSEDDLIFAIANYFIELGFETDEFSFEDQFSIQLGHNTLIVGREDKQPTTAQARSDLLLTRSGIPIAIVETKNPTHNLTSDDAWQAISYARLLKKIAPYAFVTNGSETKVYDVFAPSLTTLESPDDSIWHKKGQAVLAIGDDLRYEAGRRLIALNEKTLSSFCRHQVERSIADFRGTIEESKYYIPSLYLPRAQLDQLFAEWLISDVPCFAAVGASGLGKTNFICATVEAQASQAFILFYPARRLRNGLMEAIRNDFVWEFHREREVQFIIDRFNDIASGHGRPFIIFVDGLDEYPESQEVFKNELIDFAPRLFGTQVKLCVSCKAFDWSNFVIDDNLFYNQLAKTVYPLREETDLSTPENSAKASNVGVWLEPFSEEELNIVFEKYRTLFSLKGDLRDATRAECKTPLMLRFIAEVFRGNEAELPGELSVSEIFDKYWERKLGRIPQHLQNSARVILCKLAEMSVEKDVRQVDLLTFQQGISWSEDAFQFLLRLNLIQQIEHAHMLHSISFEFEKMRSYTYSVQAKRWPKQAPEEVAQMVRSLFESHLGLEAIEFYFTVIDQGTTSILTELAKISLEDFVQLVNALDLRKSTIDHLLIDKRRNAFWQRVTEFANFHTSVRQQYFESVLHKIEPYSKRPTGLWVGENTEMYQLRVRTDRYPQPVVFVPQEYIAELFQNRAPAELLADLRPVGTLYINGLSHFVDELPQVLAWHGIERQIGNLFGSRMLDESSSYEMLAERITNILLYSPNIWVQGEKRVHQCYWQMLGFQSTSDLQDFPIQELLTKIHELARVYIEEFPIKTPINHLSHSERGSYNKYKELQRLTFCLQLAGNLSPTFFLPKSHTINLDIYRRTQRLDQLVTPVELLFPEILQAYRKLVHANFSAFENDLKLFRHPDTCVRIEISHDQYGNIANLRYVLLPSSHTATENQVQVATKRLRSVKNVRLMGISQRSPATGYGITDFEIGNSVYEVPTYFTRFPTSLPVVDQAYQLLGFEMAELLCAQRSFEWNGIEFGDRGRHDNWLDGWIYDLALKKQLGLDDFVD